MTKLRSILQTLEKIAPLRYAEAWDNVGLLAGDREQSVSKVMLTIDMTLPVVEEALKHDCQLVLAYHPPIFDGLKRIDARSAVGLALRHGIAIYSPHTALDAAPGGTNDVLADALGLEARSPIKPAKPGSGERFPDALANQPEGAVFGMGRIGTRAPVSGTDFVALVKARLGLEHVLVAGPLSGPIKKVAVAAGAAGELLKLAIAQGAQAIVCGELRHHDALAAASAGIMVICLRHSCSERPALTALRSQLVAQHSELEFLLSELDRDPFCFQ